MANMNYGSDPNGINYPKDQELRNNLAEELRKVLDMPNSRCPGAEQAMKDADNWPEYRDSLVKLLKASSKIEDET